MDSDTESELDLPVLQAGDIVDGGHYKLVKWLGKGQFSTVWQARPVDGDEPKKRRGRKKKNASDAEQHDVAIKFYTTDPLYADLGHNEADNLRKVDGADIPYLQHLLGQVKEPFLGNIMPLATYDLNTFLNDKGVFKAKAAAFSLLQLCFGLKFLHDQCIAHGDLKPENILVYHNGTNSRAPVTLTISDFDSLQFYTPESLAKHGRRRPRDEESTDLPRDRITSRIQPDLGIKENRIAVSDTEEAYVEEPCVTYDFRAPEFILNGEYAAPADIWSLACVYYELRTGAGLFDLDDSGDSEDESDGDGLDDEDDGGSDAEGAEGAENGPAEQIANENTNGEEGDSDSDCDSEEEEQRNVDHLTLMIDILGPVPRSYMQQHPDIFTPKGTLRNIKPTRTTMQKILQEDGLGRKDANQSANLLKAMLHYEPNNRYTANDVEEHIRSAYRTYSKDRMPDLKT